MVDIHVFPLFNRIIGKEANGLSRGKKKPSSKLEIVKQIVEILAGITTIIGTIYSMLKG